MMIDSHNHVGGPDKGDGARQSHSDIIAAMDGAGVDKAVIFPFNETEPGISFSNANNYILEGVKKYPDRLIGFARLDPNFKEAAVEEAERAIGLGLTGIKLHPKGQNFPPSHPWALKIVEKSAELGVPVVFDNGKDISPNREIAKLAERVEEAVIILAHMRGGDFVEVAQENENIYLGTVKADVADVEKAIAAIGPKRIIAGSDSPYASMKYEMIDKFDEIDVLSQNDKALIRGGNTAKILGIS
jgi:predicted TIM-barrel fold metal-dependent hydrolase